MPATPSTGGVRTLGRYALYEPIASGGMATVHLGRLIGAAGFSRTVAIKRLHSHFAQDPQFVMMFMDEARVAGRIRHPNVVPTLDVVSADEELFLVMEYVEGESLSRLHKVTRKAAELIPLPVACSILAGVLHGLHAAHEARDERGDPLGIVHRDISPQNVLVGRDGVARIVDFGVAKATGRLQTTREGQLKGKLTYMAPELFGGAAPDPRVDIYAAAVVLWEVLAGRNLFTSETDAEAVGKILANKVKPPSELRPEVTPALDAVVLRGLVGDPSARFGTAKEMALALEKAAPIASPGAVSAWVEKGAAQVLAERAGKVARLERDSHSDREQAASIPDVEPITLLSAPTHTEAETSLSHSSDHAVSRGRMRSARIIAAGIGAGILAASAVLWLAPGRRAPAPVVSPATAARSSPALAPSLPASASAAAPIESAAAAPSSEATSSSVAPRSPPPPHPTRKPPPVHFGTPD